MTTGNGSKNGVRQWFRDKAGAIKLYAGAITAVIAVMVAWESVDWLPKWTWKSEFQAFAETVDRRVASVEQLNKDTRGILLGLTIETKSDKLDSLQQRYEQAPNEDLRQRIRSLEKTLEELHRQQDRLEDERSNRGS